MLLHNNNRMTALITIICLTLLIYCLVEREVRNAITPTTTLPNLYTGRPAKPTALLIFRAPGTLRMIPTRNSAPPVIPQPSPHQLHLLNLPAVDPRQPRDGKHPSKGGRQGKPNWASTARSPARDCPPRSRSATAG
jgi:hypothetical protein